MCLGIPAKIIEINGEYATADIDGAIIQIGLQLIENPKVGDFVLVHTGYALEKIDEYEALDTIENIKKLTNKEDFPI
jgi:hydrogenase expression/formation protein HypC